MNLAIKTLEEIGQNTSIKQHDSLFEMLKDLNIQNEGVDNVDLINSELICGLFPADDSDDSEDNTDDDNQEEE